MPDKSKLKREARKRRHQRIRKKISGTREKPRLSVFRSLKHIYAQLINDTAGETLLSVSDLSPELKNPISELQGKTAISRSVGRFLAQKAKELGIKEVVFDRGGYLYHGRVKALAEGAREGGLKF